MLKAEFSKKLAVLSWIVCLAMTALAVVLPIFYLPSEGVLAVLPYSWGEVTAVQAFYLWKAKNENRTKVPIMVIQSLPDKIREVLDLNQIITSIIQAD